MDLTPANFSGFSSPAPLATADELLAALPWGVVVLDAQDVIRRVNPQAAQWCGAPAGALVDQPLAQVPLPPALSTALRQLREPGAAQLEVWLPPTQQWLSLRATPAPAGQHWVFMENVTARRQAEDARQRSSQLLVDMEAVAHTGSYEADLVSGSLYFSDGMYRLFGEAPQAFEVTLDVIDARSHPADAAAVQQILGQAISTRQPYTYRRRIRRADGQWRTLEAHGEVRCDAAGQAVQLRGLVQDVTERVRAEQQLRETKELLQATLDSSHYVVQVFKAVRDASGAIVDFTWILTNKTWLKQYGGAMAGKRLLQENPGVVETGLFKLFVQVTETGVPVDHEQYYAHEQFKAWFHQTLVRMGDGFVMNTIDITERKQAQEKIIGLKEQLAQQALDRYRILFETIDEGFCVMELVLDEQAQVTDLIYREANAAFEQHAGFGDVVGKRASEIFPRIESHWLNSLARVQQTGMPERLEGYNADTDHWFTLQYSRVGGAGSPFVAALFSDITERKQREAQLRQAAAAETFRLQLADALGPLADAVAMQEAVTRLARQHFKADRCYYCEIEGGQAIIRRDAATEGLPSVAGTYPLAEFTLLQAVIEAGRPFIVRDVREEESVDESLRQLCVQLHVISYLDIPVIKNGQPVGVLCLVQSTPREWTAAETALAVEVAERAWSAVERARAEEALRASEQRLRLITDATPALIAYVDAGLRYRFVNQRYQEWFGRAPQELRGQRLREVVGGEAFARLRPHVEAALAGQGQSFEEELTFRTAGPRHVQTEFVPDVQPDGSVAGYYSFVTDITERKHHEQRQAFLLHFSDALRAEPTAAAVAHRALRLLSAQLGLDRCYLAEYHLEADHADIPYQVGNDRVPPLPVGGIRLSDFPEAFRVVFDRTLVIDNSAEGAGLSDADRRNISALGLGALVAATLRQGEHRPDRVLVAVSAAPRHWTPSQVALIEEVAERTWAAVARARTEAALRAVQDSLQIALEAAEMGTWHLDLATDFASQRSLRHDQLFGYDNPPPAWGQEIARRHVLEEDRAAFDAGFARALETGELRFEVRVRWPDGRLHWMAYHGRFYFDAVGQPVRGAGVNFDITARKQVEEALRASEEKFRTLFETIDEGFCVQELLFDEHGQVADMIYREANAAFERHTGLAAANGKRASAVFPHIESQWFDALARVHRTGVAERLEAYNADTNRWLTTQYSRIGHAGSPFIAAVFNDITERKRREINLAFLAEVSQDLVRLTNIDATMNALGEKLAAHLGLSACAFAELTDSAQTGIIRHEWHRAGLPSFLGTYRMAEFVAPEVLRRCQAGEAVVIRDVWADPLTDGAQYAALHVGSFVSMPLVREGEWRFLLVVYRPTPYDWTTDEVDLLREVTNRIWTRLERARAEEALRTSEEKYRTLFETIDEGFAMVEVVPDEHGRVTDVVWREANAGVERHAGLGGWVGQRASEILPNLEPGWLEAMTSVYHTGEPVRMEAYLADLDRWLDTYYARIGGAGSPLLAAVFNDITERKHREQRQEFLLKLSDALRDEPSADAVANRALFMLSEQLRLDRSYITTYYLDANRAEVDYQLGNDSVPPLPDYFVLSDYPDTFATTSKNTIVIEDDWERRGLSEAERRSSKKLGMRAMVGATLRRENKPFWSLVVSSSRPRRWTPSEIALVEEVAERTLAAIERVRAEEALAAGEARLRALISNLPGAAAFVVDPDLRYQLAGGEALATAGLTPADLLGRTVAEAMPPELVAQHEAHYRQALAGQEFSLEHTAHGRTFVSRGVPLLDAAGRPEAVLVVSYDITARKQAEEALQVSELKYRTLFETMDQGFGIGQVLPADEAAGTPLDWQWLEINPQFERLTGLPRAAVLSQTTRQLLPGLEEVWYERYAQAAAGETVNFESYSTVLDRWFDVYAFALGPPDNRRVAVLFSNTSEHKQVEAALREAEARHREQLEQQVAERTRQLQESRDLLQSVFDTSLISMSVLHAVRDEAGQVQDFRLALVNKELARETGRTDLVGKFYAQEYPGIRQVGIFDLMLRALATGEPQGMEYFYDQEGFSQWFTCQFVKMGDGVVATNLDITERKIAEQERLKNLRLLEQAEAVAGLGSWDYSLATGHMRWSAGMYDLFGLPVGSSVEPSHYLAAVVDDDRPRAEQLVHRLTAGQGFEETLRLRVREQVKTVRMKAVVLRDEAGQPVRILGVDVDISALQRLEADNLRLRLGQQQALFEAVQAAQEAERKRMAESLHNGIGQILYATKLRLDLLRSPLLAPDPAQEAVRQEADYLLGEAIRQTRALSHELVPMILEEFGLAAALQDIGQKMSTAQLHLRTHAVLDEAAAPLTPMLQMALYRMAQELAQNIAKHAHGATEASLELETTPGWVLLRAEDNGPGFAASPASADGLGLRSIRDQVALLGGRVESGSRMAGGAYVRIRLPLPGAPA